MAFLDALFAGAKVLVNAVAPVLGQAVRVVLDELDRSPFGRAAIGLMGVVKRKYFSEAADLAAEEADLVAKAKRDGKQREVDRVRQMEIEAQRERLRKDLEMARAAEAAAEFKSSKDEVIAAPIAADEVSATTALLATKECQCGGVMTIRQDALDTKTGKRKFFWECNDFRGIPCKRIYFDPSKGGGAVLRKPDADLDGQPDERRRVWERPDVIVKTHGRVRQSLEQTDEEVVCPTHAMPMRLVEKRGNDGKMLGSYEYVCLGIKPDGRACDHKVSLESFPQVSAMLRRRDGKGIVDG